VSTAIFLCLLRDEDKAQALAETIAALREGRRLESMVYPVPPTSFRQVPGSPFAYWVSNLIRRKFIELPRFESQGREVRLGDHPSDDFRYLRLFWETPMNIPGRDWRPYQKGGDYSPYYYDLHLVVDWDASRQTYRGFHGRPGRPNERPSNYQYFFRPGLTWPRRTTSGLSVRILPGGCIFADKRPTVFASLEELMRLLALMNSRAFQGLVGLRLAAAGAAARSYEVGLIQDTPVVDLSGRDGERLTALAQQCINLKCQLVTARETSHIFHLPALLQVSRGALGERLTGWQAHVAETERQLGACQREIDDTTFYLYGIDGDDRRVIEDSLNEPRSESNDEGQDTDSTDEETEVEPTADGRQLVADLLSYAVGCVFGRWDVRFATEELQPPKLTDPFAPLPVRSRGMLTGKDGLPLREFPPEYPLRIDQDGILIDDSDNLDDIVRHVREVLELLWQDRAEAIEREACEILGVKELRDYFRRPGKGGFWDDHVSRHSKSRRKAPIYWLLQSSKKNYALWMYYHRFDKDMLFKALLNYVEPKIRQEEDRLELLRAQRTAAGTLGKGVKKLEKEIERQEEFVFELRDFEDKLRGVANLHLEPDLNDGVVLNIAPLWELVPWKEAKKYWEELRDGKYEWSSIGKQLRQKGIAHNP
jgi:hypothetical protein